MTTPLHYETATGLAGKIAQGQISSVEAVEHHLQRIAALNPQLNAIVIDLADRARARAELADTARSRGETWGPLHGVPITVKESFNIEGEKTTINFSPIRNHVAREDALIVQRLEAAGAVIVGKTNVPTLLADHQTHGPIYPRANNPYDLERCVGGSTGGGGAAIAAGFATLETGTDIGGSIRIPSHYNGIYGLKSTEHTIPSTGHVPPLPGAMGSLRLMSTIGPMARCIEDLAVSFDILRGPDPSRIQVPPIDFLDVRRAQLPDYRLAWTDSVGDYACGQATSTLLKGLAEKLAGAGVKVKQDFPALDVEDAFAGWARLYGHVISSEASWWVKALMKANFAFSPTYGGRGRLIAKGINSNLKSYVRALYERQQTVVGLSEFFDRYDFLLMPVSTGPAFTHRKTGQSIEVDGKQVPYWEYGLPFMFLSNLCGNPALVVPLGQQDGLPIGLQIVGPHWSEKRLIAFGKLLEPLIQGFVSPPNFP